MPPLGYNRFKPATNFPSEGRHERVLVRNRRYIISMYAIIETGGKQIKVEVGDTIYVEKLPNGEGDEVSFDKVLMVGGEKSKVGTPYVKGAVVKGRVTKNGKNKKIVVFKYKAKANYRRTSGHRQPYTRVSIDSIEC